MFLQKIIDIIHYLIDKLHHLFIFKKPYCNEADYISRKSIYKT